MISSFRHSIWLKTGHVQLEHELIYPLRALHVHNHRANLQALVEASEENVFAMRSGLNEDDLGWGTSQFHKMVRTHFEAEPCFTASYMQQISYSECIESKITVALGLGVLSQVFAFAGPPED